MADSRCTNYMSSRLFNENLMVNDAGINPFGEAENYRSWLMTKGTQDITKEYNCSVFEYKEDYAYPK